MRRRATTTAVASLATLTLIGGCSFADVTVPESGSAAAPTPTTAIAATPAPTGIPAGAGPGTGGPVDVPAAGPAGPAGPAVGPADPAGAPAAGTAIAGPVAPPVGPGCAAYAAAHPTGPGSFADLAGQPVAAAVAQIPVLTQLNAAITGGLNPGVNIAGLVNAGDYTVFAPVDGAFAALPPAELDTYRADSAALTARLSHHVIAGQLTPQQIIGTRTTLSGLPLAVVGTPEALQVGGQAATVVCGGITTANAQLYLVDQVLPAGDLG